MKKSLLLNFIFVCAFVLQAFAQGRTVTGTVTSAADGSPLPGVTVVVKGTTTGTNTDINGRYSINVPASGGTLAFSFLGYQAKEVPVGNQSSVSVALAQSSTALNEVVVTAFGIERQLESLGYATQEVSADQLSQRAEPNVVNALQGKVAGVNITSSSGVPGSSTNIVIRGMKSIEGNNQPLFVVDGIPIDNSTNTTESSISAGSAFASRALDLNPEDIESINVLKGPAAAALYGSRAANGALIITTKKGAAGGKGVSVTVTSSYILSQVTGLPQYQNEFGQGTFGVFNPASGFSWGPRIGAEIDSVTSFPGDPRGTKVAYRAYPDNWRDFFRTGHIISNNVQVRGGDAKNNVILSIGNTNQEGMVPNTSLGRTNLRLAANTSLSDKFRVGGSFSYVNTQQEGTAQGNNASSLYWTGPTLPRNLDLTGIPYEDAVGNQIYYSASSDNPLWSAEHNTYFSEINRIIGNANASYDATDWLSFSYQIGGDAYVDNVDQVYDIGSRRIRAGRIIQQSVTVRNIESNFLATLKKEFNEDFKGNLILGHNVNQRTFSRQRFTGDAIIVPGNFSPLNTTTYLPTATYKYKRRLVGVFADAQLSYKDFLFLSVTGRNDWSSTLPEENNSFFYPSISSSFVFTEVLGLNSDAFLSYGKIRGNYAKVGADAPVYLTSSVVEVPSLGNNVSSIEFPFLGQPGYEIGNQIGNNQLTPEFTTSWEVGTDLTFLRDRARIDFTYYNSKSESQILAIDIPASTGYTSLVTNTGLIRNRGIELLASVKFISNSNFKWETTGNFTRNRSKVESLAAGLERTQVGGFLGFGSFLIEGQPYGVMVGPKNARDPETGQLLVNSSTGQLLTGPANEVIGDPNPDYTLNVINNFKYKGLRFSFQFDFQKGGDIYSGTEASAKSSGAAAETAVDRHLPRVFPGLLANPTTGEVLKDGEGNPIPNNILIPAVLYWNAMGSFSEWGVQDATHLRLREIVLGYTLPTSLFKSFFKEIDFSVSARNLWLYAPNLVHFDPETSSEGAGNSRGFEYNGPPQARNFGVNLRLTF